MTETKNIFTNKSSYIFILGALFVLLFLRQCNRIENLKNEVKITKELAEREHNNYLASKDTIRITKAKNGNLISEVRSYEFDLDNLKEEQGQLITRYKKALNLNNDLNKVNTLLSANVEIKDSIIANTELTYIDTLSSKLTFSKFDDFGKGNTRNLFGELLITKLDSGFAYGNPYFKLDQTITLMAAIEDNNGYDEIKISTGYPGLTITDIENINLINTKLNQRNEKKAGWSIGVGVGYGINLNNNQVISTGPSIGIGVYWSPKWLRF
jgi:hypothetical protein